MTINTWRDWSKLPQSTTLSWIESENTAKQISFILSQWWNSQIVELFREKGFTENEILDQKWYLTKITIEVVNMIFQQIRGAIITDKSHILEVLTFFSDWTDQEVLWKLHSINKGVLKKWKLLQYKYDISIQDFYYKYWDSLQDIDISVFTAFVTEQYLTQLQTEESSIQLLPFFHICKDAEYAKSFFELYAESVMEWLVDIDIFKILHDSSNITSENIVDLWDIFKSTDRNVLKALVINKWFSIQDWFWKEIFLSSPEEFNSLAKVIKLFRSKWLYTNENKDFCFYLANISNYELLDLTISLWYDNIEDLKDIADILISTLTREELKYKLVKKKITKEYKKSILKSLKRSFVFGWISHVTFDWELWILTPFVFLFTWWWSAIKKWVSYKENINKHTHDHIESQELYERLVVLRWKQNISLHESRELGLILEKFKAYPIPILKNLPIKLLDVHIIVNCLRASCSVNVITRWTGNFQYIDSEKSLEEIYLLLDEVTSFKPQEVHDIGFDYEMFGIWKSRLAERLWKESSASQDWSSSDYISSLEVWKYYKLLGIPRTSSKSKVNKAYKDISKIYHPDNQETWDPDMMRQINQAKKNIFIYKGWK